MSFEDRRMKEQRRSMIKNDFQTTHLGAPLPHARRVARRRGRRFPFHGALREEDTREKEGRPRVMLNRTILQSFFLSLSASLCAHSLEKQRRALFPTSTTSPLSSLSLVRSFSSSSVSLPLSLSPRAPAPSDISQKNVNQEGEKERKSRRKRTKDVFQENDRHSRRRCLLRLGRRQRHRCPFLLFLLGRRALRRDPREARSSSGLFCRRRRFPVLAVVIESDASTSSVFSRPASLDPAPEASAGAAPVPRGAPRQRRRQRRKSRRREQQGQARRAPPRLRRRGRPGPLFRARRALFLGLVLL